MILYFFPALIIFFLGFVTGMLVIRKSAVNIGVKTAEGHINRYFQQVTAEKDRLMRQYFGIPDKQKPDLKIVK